MRLQNKELFKTKKTDKIIKNQNNPQFKQPLII